MGLLLIVLIAGGTLGWSLHPDTRVEQITISKYYCPVLFQNNGEFVWSIEADEVTKCDEIIKLKFNEKKSISVLAEKKECEEKGGEFTAIGSQVVKEYESFIKENMPTYQNVINKISCTKPYKNGNITGTETIFEYEIK